MRAFIHIHMPKGARAPSCDEVCPAPPRPQSAADAVALPARGGKEARLTLHAVVLVECRSGSTAPPDSPGGRLRGAAPWPPAVPPRWQTSAAPSGSPKGAKPLLARCATLMLPKATTVAELKVIVGSGWRSGGKEACAAQPSTPSPVCHG